MLHDAIWFGIFLTARGHSEVVIEIIENSDKTSFLLPLLMGIELYNHPYINTPGNKVNRIILNNIVLSISKLRQIYRDFG